MKIIVSILLLLCFFAAAVNAGATTIAYEPAAAALTAPAGTAANTLISLTLFNPKGSVYYLWPINAVSADTLPKEWVSAAPAALFLSGGATAHVALTITVPAGTPSGKYGATLFARAMAVHDNAPPGSGMRLEVTVPPVCGGVPVFNDVSLDPLVLWPPSHKLQSVTIKGSISVPPGCGLLEMGYVIEDEYGVYSGMGVVPAESDGSFAAILPLESWRDGTDKDGRHYRIRLYAADEAGSAGGGPWVVVVPHDQGSGGK